MIETEARFELLLSCRPRWTIWKVLCKQIHGNMRQYNLSLLCAAGMRQNCYVLFVSMCSHGVYEISYRSWIKQKTEKSCRMHVPEKRNRVRGKQIILQQIFFDPNNEAEKTTGSPVWRTCMMHLTGLEPALRLEMEPKSIASASSATGALQNTHPYYIRFCVICQA